MKSDNYMTLMILLFMLVYIVMNILNDSNTKPNCNIILDNGEVVPSNTCFTQAKYKHFYIQCIDNVVYFNSNSGITAMFNKDSTIITCIVEEN